MRGKRPSVPPTTPRDVAPNIPFERKALLKCLPGIVIPVGFDVAKSRKHACGNASQPCHLDVVGTACVGSLFSVRARTRRSHDPDPELFHVAGEVGLHDPDLVLGTCPRVLRLDAASAYDVPYRLLPAVDDEGAELWNPDVEVQHFRRTVGEVDEITNSSWDAHASGFH